MTVKTKDELLTELSTGGSSDNSVETALVIDLVNSVAFTGDALDGVTVVLPNYTIATLPETTQAGEIIYVSDGVTSLIAVSDGAQWLYTDGTAVVE